MSVLAERFSLPPHAIASLRSYGNPPAINLSPFCVALFHVRLTSFRREYSTRLAELTVNSRPRFQNLRMLTYRDVRSTCPGKDDLTWSISDLSVG